MINPLNIRYLSFGLFTCAFWFLVISRFVHVFLQFMQSTILVSGCINVSIAITVLELISSRKNVLICLNVASLTISSGLYTGILEESFFYMLLSRKLTVNLRVYQFSDHQIRKIISFFVSSPSTVLWDE